MLSPYHFADKFMILIEQCSFNVDRLFDQLWSQVLHLAISYKAGFWYRSSNEVSQFGSLHF